MLRSVFSTGPSIATGTGVYPRVGTGVLLQGLGTPCYFASVTADVRYDGASVSLEHLHLTTLGGV